ncbi:MAG: methylated-DNA--[protein]-cysteine S-methyltransferase [Smithella sp.]
MNKKIIKTTPIGSVCVVWHISNNFPLIIRVLLSRPGLSAEERVSALFPHSRTSSCMEMDAIEVSIRAYLEGDHVDIPLDVADWSLCSRFNRLVLHAQHAIPRGLVSTYGLVAAHVGAPDGARAVGNALAGNPFPVIVPCHRTILSILHSGGFQSGTEMKRSLLTNEGIIFDEAGRVLCRRLHYGKTDRYG